MTTKPTVLLLPGMLCDDAVWDAQIVALAPYFDVRVPVFRGFNSFAAMAEHARTMAPERFSVVAHSMGGRVAMELMRQVPFRIDQFILMDMGVHPVAAGEPERNRQLLDLAAHGGLEAVADHWIPFMVHPRRHADIELCEAIRAMVLRNQVSDLHGQLLAAQNRPDQRDYLPHIYHHTHIVCGEQDNWNPVNLHREMQVRLPSADLTVVPDCGHMVPMEEPELTTRLLLRWLRPSQH